MTYCGTTLCGGYPGGYRGFVQPHTLNTLVFQGPIGTQGDNGDIGSLGPLGNYGFNGRKGTKGDFGLTGNPGFDGPFGNLGSRGATGDIGPSGSFNLAGNPSTGMISRQNAPAGSFSSTKVFPIFEIVQSKKGTPANPCGPTATSVWNTTLNLLNIGTVDSPIPTEPAGFFTNNSTTKTIYTVTYNLNISQPEDTLGKTVLFECRNVTTGTVFSGSRSSITVTSNRSHLSHSFLANLPTGTTIAIYVSHLEVLEGTNNLCVPIYNSNFIVA